MFENIFESSKEIDRLAVQNRLLKEYEEPVCRRLLEGRQGVQVLDVGCNNGSKTAARFSRSGVSTVIGLEYNQALADRAQAAYGDDRFSFYRCDVEQPEFPDQLRGWMAERQVEAFDLIHLSFVLMHLKDPNKLLGILKPFLAPAGRLLIVEANDSSSVLSPDPEGLLTEFLDILAQDPFSGDRYFGGKVPKLLEEQGYSPVKLECQTIDARGPERGKKEDLFDMFFSYLPEDVQILLEQEPDHPRPVQWKRWIQQKFERLQQLVLAEGTSISMGLNIFTAGRSEDVPLRVQRLTEKYLDQITQLCGQCVGENLYSKEELASAIGQPDQCFELLLTPEDEIGGYCWSRLTPLDAAAADAKLPPGLLRERLGDVPMVARIQSVGTSPAFRTLGLCRELLERALDWFREMEASAAICTAWKRGGFVPLASNLLKCGFQHLTDSRMVWYDRKDLVCPCCEGRCKCGAAIYYKVLKGKWAT